MGLILTPSSRWAFCASSASFPDKTFLPQSVLTKVVRPNFVNECEKVALAVVQRTCARSTTNHQAELDPLLDILLSADLYLRGGHVSNSLRDQYRKWKD